MLLARAGMKRPLEALADLSLEDGVPKRDRKEFQSAKTPPGCGPSEAKRGRMIRTPGMIRMRRDWEDVNPLLRTGKVLVESEESHLLRVRVWSSRGAASDFFVFFHEYYPHEVPIVLAAGTESEEYESPARFPWILEDAVVDVNTCGSWLPSHMQHALQGDETDDAVAACMRRQQVRRQNRSRSTEEEEPFRITNARRVILPCLEDWSCVNTLGTILTQLLEHLEPPEICALRKMDVE